MNQKDITILYYVLWVLNGFFFFVTQSGSNNDFFSLPNAHNLLPVKTPQTLSK